MSIGDDLHLDVAAVLDVPLDEQGVVAERRACLAARAGQRIGQRVLLRGDLLEPGVRPGRQGGDDRAQDHQRPGVVVGQMIHDPDRRACTSPPVRGPLR